MSGNFLSCSKGVKDTSEFREVRCDYLPDASGEMGLISPGGENLLNFLELWPVLSTYHGDVRTRLGASGKASPHASCSGASRIPLSSMPGPKTLCRVGAGT